MTDEKSLAATPPDVEKAPIDIRGSGDVPTADFIKHKIDVDEAMKAFEGHEGEILVLDDATNKRLLRRIDWHLMPLLCIIYGLNFLDSMPFPQSVKQGSELMDTGQKRHCLMLVSWG